MESAPVSSAVTVTTAATAMTTTTPVSAMSSQFGPVAPRAGAAELGTIEPPAAKARAESAQFARRLASNWDLDPDLTFLNHGSYGATPRSVLQTQSALRARMEREPVRFFKADLERLLDGVREKLAAFVGCPAADLAPFSNATAALGTVLLNTPLKAGDEILVTDHEYSSGINELERIAARTGAVVVTANIPFPVRDPSEVVEAVLAKAGPRTRLAMISHVTSSTSLIFPVERIVPVLRARGIDVLVDGAHGPGQVAVDIRTLDPMYYIGSLHKWVCAPKGTGFLYVHPEKQKGFRPVCLSSRANKVRPDRALFLRDFDYMGTGDYTAMLASPAAIEAVGGLLPGGWTEIMARNHEMIVKGREIVWRALSALFPGEMPAPEPMIGSMATLVLPEPPVALVDRPTLYDDALQDVLMEKHRVAVPIWRWGPENKRVVRVSAQVYNHLSQYDRLAEVLVAELMIERQSGPRRGG